MPLSESIIAEIRQRADIVGIISQFVQLRRRGKNYVGLCPFHTEKTPSFNVSPELGIYKCFGCGKSGDTFAFLMEYNGMSFLEAVRHVAAELGIAIDDDVAHEPSTQLRRSLLQLLHEIRDFYHEQLLSPVAKAAQQFLHERGVSQRMIERFRLGYAPASWSITTDTYIKRGTPIKLLLQAGISAQREDGSAYDRFRHRLMFPIESISGDTIAFGGRLLADDPDQPKYINSPQTLLYDKSATLYALNHAKHAIIRAQHAILVEGYLDAIALHQIGVENTVATAGTALTQRHLALLRRFTEQLRIVFDGDNAGYEAAHRAVTLALQQGFSVELIVLPEGEDPDSLVRKRGADAMQHVLSKPISALEFILQYSRLHHNWSNPRVASRQIQEIAKLITAVPDALYRELLLRELSDRVGVRPELLSPSVSTGSSGRHIAHKGALSAGEVTFPSPPTLHPEEITILRAALVSRALAEEIFSEYMLEPSSLPSPAAQKLCTAIQQYISEHPGSTEPPGRLLSTLNLDTTVQELAEWLVFTDETPSARWTSITDLEFDSEQRYSRELGDAITKLEERRLERTIAELQERLLHDPENRELLQQIDRLHKLRIQLRRQTSM